MHQRLMIRGTVMRFMWRRSVTCAAVMISVAGFIGSPRLAVGGVVGQWDFANGWDADTGIVPAVSAIPRLSLSYLPKTPLYQYPAAHDGNTPPANPPQLAFATTGSFGIANLGDSSDTAVMRMPDMRSFGAVTGLMATFPRMVNGDGNPTRLNRYSVVMDVYVPQTTDDQQPPSYLTLFQTRLVNDGAWFIDKRDDTTGVASSYGGTVTPDAWHRLALVMNLSDSGAVSQYRAYVNGSLAANLVPDTVPQNSERNIDLVTNDLFTDKAFSVGTLNDAAPGLNLGPDSAFFLFNADKNVGTTGLTTGELGTLYVANLQFRDDALTDSQIAALGGPGPGLIPVPEPGTLGLLAMAGLAAAWTGLREGRSRASAPGGTRQNSASGSGGKFAYV
jgi:hypothetical protein